MPLRIAKLLTCGAALLVAMATLSACARTHDGITQHDERFEGVHYRVVSIDLAKAKLELHWHNPDSGAAFANIPALQQWGAQHGRQLLFATNAGIYDAQGRPLGMHVEAGKQLRPLNTAHGDAAAGNFSLLPNGVFSIDTRGHATVQTTDAFAAAHVQPRLATQSGPMLVFGGQINPRFDTQSDSRKWRNGVCAPSPSEAVFVVSEDPVNLYEFAKLFKDKLHCRDALYLDGTLSQIYVDGSFYGTPAFMVKPYAGMFAVFAPRTK